MDKAFSLESSRLVLREFREHDADGLYALNADAEVMRFTGDVPFTSVQAALTFVQHYDHYRRYGLGRWAVVEKVSENFLGWCGLKYHPATKETDLGFRFLQKHWNKGFATEAAMVCLHYGFEEKALAQIVGRSAKANEASIKVLVKLGMTYKRDLELGGMQGVCYAIGQSEFLQRKLRQE